MVYFAVIVGAVSGVFYAIKYLANAFISIGTYWGFANTKEYDYLYDNLLHDNLNYPLLKEYYGLDTAPRYTSKSYLTKKETVRDKGKRLTLYLAYPDFKRLVIILLGLVLLTWLYVPFAIATFLLVNAVYILLNRDDFYKIYYRRAVLHDIAYLLSAKAEKDAKKASKIQKTAVIESTAAPEKKLTPKQSIFWISVSNAAIMIVATIGMYLTDPKAMTIPGFVVLGIGLFLFFELIILGVGGVHLVANKIQRVILNKYKNKNQ
jgi:hypothetical protein